MTENIQILFTLVNSMAVIAVIAYVLTKVQFYQDIVDKKLTGKNRLLLILVFGLLSIYGTASGFTFMGAIANTRDLGPALAGLFAGPLVGVGAGVIGAVHRYSLGGITAVSCSLATIAAGLIGGLVYHWNKGRFIGVAGAVTVATVNQLVHSGLTLLIARPFGQAFAIVRDFTLPMILANSVGMGLYAFIILNLIRERALEKAKQLMVGELQAAHQIQMSMVPKDFPPFPHNTSFQLHALLEPAREVGGDLYDYFFIDANRLVFFIGDVSGKGVPAALFMAVTTTLLKATAKTEAGPHHILTDVNRELCRENETSMFVTLYCGIFHTDTGQIDFCNAGHNPPLLLRQGKLPEYLSAGDNPPLGVIEGYVYKPGSLQLSAGDTLFLYTDGITEAMNSSGNLFSEPRLAEILHRKESGSAESIIDHVLQEVRLFADGAPPSDDLTMLALRRTTAEPAGESATRFA